MRLPSALTQAMMNHLGQTYFEQVWNAPNDSGRVNFSIRKVADRLQTGIVPIGLSVVGLPTTDKVFAVYQVPYHVFGRFINLPPQTWIKDSEILTTQRVLLSTYNADGRTIPDGGVWLRYDPLTLQVLIAIDRKYTTGCIGEAVPNLFMTVFYDTSRRTPTVSNLYTVSAQTPVAYVMGEIQEATADYPGGVWLSVNGWIYIPNKVPALKMGDIVQITCDPDLVGYCELYIDDNLTGYYSELYGEYRELLHIPKVLNANNVTVTIDTLNMVLFDPVTGRGIMAHRIDPHALESITHNDFSVSRTSLQAFQNGLGAQGLKARLYVRFPTQPQTLPDDVNHIKDMYLLSDTEIKKQLAGTSSHQIAEWKASHLEKSTYLKLLYNFDYVGEQNLLVRYADAMGYYSVASTLADTLRYYTYRGSEVQVFKPARLIDVECDVLVYANGVKIPQSLIKIVDNCGSFLLSFTNNNYIVPGTRIGVYVTEKGIHAGLPYSPTLVNPSITVEHDDYTLVKVVRYNSDQKIWKGTTRTGYKPIPLSPADYRVTNNPDGSATYRVSSIHYGSDFYLIPSWGLTTLRYELDTQLDAKQALTRVLQIKDVDGNLIPLLGTKILEVYINGLRLIEGVDYTCDPVLGSDNDVLQKLLVITNQEYVNLAQSGNSLEVVIHGDGVASFDKGYVIDNKMHRNLPPMMWTASCGRAFVRGKLVEQVTEQGSTLVSATPLMDGSPYLTEWTIPYGVRKIMTNLNATGDEDLRTRIYRVLGLDPVVYPELVSITDQYALYSPYLAQIVADVANGAFTIIDETKDSAFLNQFEKYDLLFDRDLILRSTNPLLDRRFVTLAAHYKNMSVNDPKQMIQVQRLIRLTLLPAQLSIGEVLL